MEQFGTRRRSTSWPTERASSSSGRSPSTSGPNPPTGRWASQSDVGEVAGKELVLTIDDEPTVVDVTPSPDG